MTLRRTTPRRPDLPEKHDVLDGVLTAERSNKSGHKTVIFPDKLEDQVQTIADATRMSFTKTALSLIEKGLEARELSPAADLVRMGELPTWLAIALQESAKARGLNFSAVVVDILTLHVRDYLEQSRAKEAEMIKLLKLPSS